MDQLGPSETPGAPGVYTHKMDLELDAAIPPLARLGAEGWLGDLELEGSMDYTVTGIPDAGDRFGDDVFPDDANPWSRSVVLVVPPAPLE